MSRNIKHFAIMAGLTVIAVQHFTDTAYAAQEGTNKIKPVARNANTDRLGNFEILLINAPRDPASGQATGQ